LLSFNARVDAVAPARVVALFEESLVPLDGSRRGSALLEELLALWQALGPVAQPSRRGPREGGAR
jgi:hypothetical protein